MVPERLGLVDQTTSYRCSAPQQCIAWAPTCRHTCPNDTATRQHRGHQGVSACSAEGPDTIHHSTQRCCTYRNNSAWMISKSLTSNEATATLHSMLWYQRLGHEARPDPCYKHSQLLQTLQHEHMRLDNSCARSIIRTLPSGSSSCYDQAIMLQLAQHMAHTTHVVQQATAAPGSLSPSRHVKQGPSDGPRGMYSC
jgi:hypothetical protein